MPAAKLLFFYLQGTRGWVVKVTGINTLLDALKKIKKVLTQFVRDVTISQCYSISGEVCTFKG